MGKLVEKSMFEKEISEVWGLVRETREDLKKSWERLEEQKAENDRQLEKEKKEREKRAKEHDKRIKELNNLFTRQWGKLIEALAEGSLVQLLKTQDIEVTRTLNNIVGYYNQKEIEFDIIAMNGSEMVVVEVKTTFRKKHVDSFLEKMVGFKNYCREYRPWKVYGAIAYIKSNVSARLYAEQKGLFVICAVGKNAVLMNTKGFKPRKLS